MLACTRTGQFVPTGIETDLDTFIALPEALSKIKCPAREAGDGIVAEANARAAEVELKTEQLRKAMAWRRLDKETFATEISGSPNAAADFVYAENDPDSFHLAVTLQILLLEAGWRLSRCFLSIVAGPRGRPQHVADAVGRERPPVFIEISGSR
jgi:hypothetical protein